MSLVLDSSLTLAWIYPDESTEQVRKVNELIEKSGAWASSLWRLEVANVLEMNVRRGKTDAAFRDATLADLALLPIRIDTHTDQYAWSATVRLAGKHRLTIYDASYLEIAVRRGLPLASLDRDLRRAAREEKVFLLGI